LKIISEWSNERNFKRGEVYFATLPEEPQINDEPSYVMNGSHRVVVLFNSDYPQRQVTVIPITSLYKPDGTKKFFLEDNYVLLDKDEYAQEKGPYKALIDKPSFIKTDQITTITRNQLERYMGEILPRDLMELDLKLVVTLGLKDTVNRILQEKVVEILEEQRSSRIKTK
jgi:uncharacterized protein YifN (PemK superfamily)